MVPSTSPSVTPLTWPLARSGGFILKFESNARSDSSVSVKWWGVTSVVTRMPRRLARRTASTALPVETCITW